VVRTETKTNINFGSKIQKEIYERLDCLRAKVTRCEYTFVKIVATQTGRRLKESESVSFNVGATYTCDDDGDSDGCRTAQEQLSTQPDKHSAGVVSDLQDDSAFEGMKPTLERQKTEEAEPVEIQTIQEPENEDTTTKAPETEAPETGDDDNDDTTSEAPETGDDDNDDTTTEAPETGDDDNDDTTSEAPDNDKPVTKPTGESDTETTTQDAGPFGITITEDFASANEAGLVTVVLLSMMI